MDCKITVEGAGKNLSLSINGGITAETNLPRLLEQNYSQVIFDLMGVSYINSGGIRNWILWQTSARATYPTAQFTYKNLPYILVRQAFSIKELLPKGSHIESFSVPYYCIKCNQAFDLSLSKDKDLNPSLSKAERVALISERPCPKCGTVAEIDAVPEHYLSL